MKPIRLLATRVALCPAILALALLTAPVSLAASPSSAFANAEFNGVSCLSMSACTAVGSGSAGPVAGRWDGSRWTPQSVPIAAGDTGLLYGVSCPSSARCIAVGAAGATPNHPQALAEGWNGTSWSVLRVRLPGGSMRASGLLGVSCPRSASCEAVGYYQRKGGRDYHALAESWNGSRWTLQKVRGTAPPWAGASGLIGVSCPSAGGCFAVGPGLIEHWSGQHWLLQRSRGVGDLDAVSCASGNHCWAVGSGWAESTHEYLWNGRRWTTEGEQAPYSALYGISCPSRRSCTGVGNSVVDSGESQATAAQWPATGRSSSNVPSPPNGDAYTLNGVYCASRRACIAVGGADLVSTWNGKTWSSTTP